ncbi:asparagine synthase-related protein [Virgibacillus necropolis]|uniref:asparagine synthase (glutamine-hydrolyzing) n=1 Tax=Virgibacillus necropolis TaxID=163877 RepID=A0A221ME96_9BACI|nr:asparagine synthase-related protein [Virgibacillus necropolis]ASN05983.1 asparagine synthetase B [Virgibacillus necropolis]
MSAIAGIYNSNNEPISNEQSNGMMQTLQRFPADDIQIWQQRNIFLGCQAQWITPESVEEPLPYYDYERQLSITADAIIDNREELFESLQVKKYKRKIMPDSQLILLAYCRWGDEVAKHLVGDFAFMIWDEQNQKLFGARDFSGARTLYFYNNHHCFAFCTVIQPLLSLPYVEKSLNEEWLADFLAIPDMFDTVNPLATVYKGIDQIPPSHTISVIKGNVTLSRYSTLTTKYKLNLKSNTEYEEAFKELFGNVVNDYLRTDHKVGSRLSGGLDSGSVVGFAAKALEKDKKQLHTFSYVPMDGFEDWTPKSKLADERPFIKSTVNHVGNINPNYLSFPDKSPLTEMDKWLDVLEMPYKFFENSYWISGIYEVASQQGVKVLLNGSRGNYTISWGNALDYYTKLFRSLRWINLNREINAFIHVKGTGRKRVLSVIGKKTFPSIKNKFSSRSEPSIPMLINLAFAERKNVFERIQSFGIDETGSTLPSTFEARENQFEKLFYRSNGTVDTKFSLRNSIWNRDPTNDLRVVQFCLSVPDSQYIQKGVDRSLIRRVTKNILPDKVRLNHLVKGAQGVDGIQRLLPQWSELINEFQSITTDPAMAEYLNLNIIKSAMSKVKENPKPELILDSEFKLLMRSLIVYRFIKKTF